MHPYFVDRDTRGERILWTDQPICQVDTIRQVTSNFHRWQHVGSAWSQFSFVNHRPKKIPSLEYIRLAAIRVSFLEITSESILVVESSQLRKRTLALCIQVLIVNLFVEELPQL